MGQDDGPRVLADDDYENYAMHRCMIRVQRGCGGASRWKRLSWACLDQEWQIRLGLFFLLFLGHGAHFLQNPFDDERQNPLALFPVALTLAGLAFAESVELRFELGDAGGGLGEGQ